MSSSARRVAAEVLQELDIAFDDLQPLEGGRVNQVVRSDSGYVVRLADDPASSQRLEAEARLLGRLREIVPTWEILASGRRGGYTYQIYPFIRGDNLTNTWAQLTATEKDRVVEQLTRHLRALHGLRFEGFGPVQDSARQSPTWSSCLLDEVEEVLSTLRPLAGGARCDAVRSWARSTGACLEDTRRPRLVHNDLWFNNLLVDGSEIVGLIDFEFAVRGAPDLELYKLEYFVRSPEAFHSQGDFADFLPRFRAAYPELFAVEDLDARLDLYDLWFYCRSFAFELEMGGGECAPEALDELFEHFHLLVTGQISRLL